MLGDDHHSFRWLAMLSTVARLTQRLQIIQTSLKPRPPVNHMMHLKIGPTWAKATLEAIPLQRQHPQITPMLAAQILQILKF